MKKYPAKLNIGCGWDKREGFLNIDLHEFHKPDLVADACNLDMLPSSHFSYIVAQDVLEHLGREKTQVAINEWSRVLCKDGIISIRVPSLFDMFYLLSKPENRKAENAEKVLHLIYGTQAYTGDYHLAGFTAEILNAYLKRAGLMVSRASIVDEWLFDIDARKTDDLQNTGEIIHYLYFLLLGRPVDHSAFEYYSEALNFGNLSRTQLEDELRSSKEYQMLETQPRYLRNL